jgi:sphinganine-1-phosphate aldolase
VNWPGGIYGSPTVAGSRAGNNIATTWACLLYHGIDGYVENTKAIVDTAKYIERKLREMKGLYIFGSPVTSVVAMGSKVFDIYRLSDGLNKKGWNLNTLQFPSGIHICVTYLHTKDGVADNFLKDVGAIIKELMINPEKPVEGKMAIYGVSQTIPDRSIVGDFTRLFLDSLYFTPKKPKKLKKLSVSGGEKLEKYSSFDNQGESNDVTLINE